MLCRGPGETPQSAPADPPVLQPTTSPIKAVPRPAFGQRSVGRQACSPLLPMKRECHASPFGLSRGLKLSLQLGSTTLGPADVPRPGGGNLLVRRRMPNRQRTRACELGPAVSGPFPGMPVRRDVTPKSSCRRSHSGSRPGDQGDAGVRTDLTTRSHPPTAGVRRGWPQQSLLKVDRSDRGIPP